MAHCQLRTGSATNGSDASKRNVKDSHQPNLTTSLPSPIGSGKPFITAPSVAVLHKSQGAQGSHHGERVNTASASSRPVHATHCSGNLELYWRQQPGPSSLSLQSLEGSLSLVQMEDSHASRHSGLSLRRRSGRSVFLRCGRVPMISVTIAYEERHQSRGLEDFQLHHASGDRVRLFIGHRSSC